MKSLTKLLTLSLTVAVLTIGFLGCSGSDSSSPDLTTRLYMAAAESGTLTPTGNGDEFVITLSRVFSSVLWFTDRPARETGEDTTEDFVQYKWSLVYGEVAPNAVIKFFVLGENAGIFATLKNPEYDSDAGTLKFHATLLNSTFDEQPESTLEFEKPVVTVLNNVTDQDGTPLTFVVYGESASLDATATKDQYTLTQNGLDDKVLWASNAPSSSSHVTTTQAFVEVWDTYFSKIPPSACIFGTTDNNELQAYLVELTHPEYPAGDDSIAYSATGVNHGCWRVRQPTTSDSFESRSHPTNRLLSKLVMQAQGQLKKDAKQHRGFSIVSAELIYGHFLFLPSQLDSLSLYTHCNLGSELTKPTLR